MVIQESMTVMEKLGILADAAKYDVACTSSGTARKGDGTGIGNSISAGICHSFAGDGRCISLLKVLYTNECVFDCKYCVNRASSDVVRASFTPEEISRLTIEFYMPEPVEETPTDTAAAPAGPEAGPTTQPTPAEGTTPAAGDANQPQTTQ